MGKKNTELSKTMSYVLRHGANEESIPIREDGYATIADLLEHRLFQGYTEKDIIAVVETSDKKRFELTADGRLIRAAQGHSMKLPEIEYTEITDASLYPYVIHGTYSKVLPLIMASGLNRMARTHIHFAPALPKDGVISGMRSSADVVIEIDLRAAMADGIKFFRSSNEVILTEGIDGILPAKYFKSVTDRRGAELI